MLNFAVKLVATVAMQALQMGLQASRRTYGPRLDELQVSTAEYGTPLPRFRGERKFACPVFHAEDLKEVETTSKTKGGKATTYSYFGTFACATADCPIDKVLKVWFDDKLVYDATKKGPMSFISALIKILGGGGIRRYMRIYLGDEAQLPDKRYASWCEDKYGPDSAPAYRGVSYLFFEDLPLQDYGNRIPQISVLATTAAAGSFPGEWFATPTTFESTAVSLDGNYLCTAHGTSYQAFDLPSRKTIISGTLPGSVATGDDTGIAATAEGLYAYGAGVWFIGINGGATKISDVDIGEFVGDGVGYAGGEVWVYPFASWNPNKIGIPTSPNMTGVAVNFNATHVFDDMDGNAIAVGYQSGVQAIAVGPAGSNGTIISTAAYGTDGGCFGFDNGLGQYVIRQDDYLYLVDKVALTITSAVDTGTTPARLLGAFSAIPPGAETFWNGLTERKASDLSVVRTVSTGSWSVSAGGFETVGYLYEPITNAILSFTNSQPGIILRYLDRQANAGVTLGEIVTAMCDAAKLTAIDASALTQIVQGYSWTRGDVKSQMEPLLDIHDVDARPHDFTIQFLNRGGAPSGTILTRDFARSGEGSPRYKVTIAQDTDLPRMLRVNFADTEFDQQTNNVLSPLPADSVDTERDDVLDMSTTAASPAEAQQKADRYIRRLWNSRERLENALTAQCLALEPGDVTTLDLDGISMNARLEKQTFAGGRMECTFVRDETSFAALNSLTTGPSMDGRDEQVISVPAPVRGFVVDAPLKEDADADVRPLLYAGAGTYATLTFPGAVMFEATGAGATRAYDKVIATFAQSVSWGTCVTTLANVPSPWLWDRGNTLTVSLEAGMLTGVSEADVDADPELNLILVGRQGAWEYVNFTTATLNGDGTYTIGGFKRGRRGTEGACVSHQAGESWVLASALRGEEMGTDDIGGALSFKAQSPGRVLDAAPALDVNPYTGATLKPYAPARLSWSTDGTDLTGTIVRRTRVGGAWVGGTTIPLSENSEAYEVDVYHGSTFKRTISVSGTNVFTYTAAQMTADGNSVGVPPPVNVYQMSDAVGRGYALAA